MIEAQKVAEHERNVNVRSVKRSKKDWQMNNASRKNY
jgi:hypothetical protein